MRSIVNSQNQIVGIGYNGFPRGCSDDSLPWGRDAENELDTKYMYVCHAEMNAILNINTANARGCKVVCKKNLLRRCTFRCFPATTAAR